MFEVDRQPGHFGEQRFQFSRFVGYCQKCEFMCFECESGVFEECEYMCVECESEAEIAEYEYFDGSGRRPPTPLTSQSPSGWRSPWRTLRLSSRASSTSTTRSSLDDVLWCFTRSPRPQHARALLRGVLGSWLPHQGSCSRHTGSGHIIVVIARTAWPACGFLQHVASHTKSSDVRLLRGTYRQLLGRAVACM